MYCCRCSDPVAVLCTHDPPAGTVSGTSKSRKRCWHQRSTCICNLHAPLCSRVNDLVLLLVASEVDCFACRNTRRKENQREFWHARQSLGGDSAQTRFGAEAKNLQQASSLQQNGVGLLCLPHLRCLHLPSCLSSKSCSKEHGCLHVSD